MPRVTISEPGKTPQPYRFKIDHKKVRIGRGSDNDIVISCRSVSTKHCTMERVKGGYILRDTGSTNGIKLDDSLMEIIDMFDGMEVLVGDVSLEFQLSDDELEELDEETFKSHQKKKLPPITDETEEDETAKEQNIGKPQKKKASKPPEPKIKDASPPPAPGAYTHPPQPVVQSRDNPLATLLIFILVLAAFFGGMTLRHKMRTGESLPAKAMNWLNGNPEPDKSDVDTNADSSDAEQASESQEPILEDNDQPLESPADATSQDTAETLSDQLIIQINMAFNAVTEAKDEESAGFAVNQLAACGSKITALIARLDKLETPDEEERERLNAKMTAANDANIEKMKNFMPTLFGNEEVGNILEPAMNDFEKRMIDSAEVFKRFGINMGTSAE